MTKETYIIIPTFGNEGSTIRCFESIGKHTDNYKIIWVDNGSGEDSINKVKDSLEANNVCYELISNKENLGFIGGTNAGIKKALGSDCGYIAFVNNDIEVYEGWLDRMKKVLDNDPKNGIVGPISSAGTGLQAVNTIPIQYSMIFGDLPRYKNNPQEYSEIIKNKYKGVSKEVFNNVAFFCTLLKRELVDDVGLLSEELGIGYFDDNDYCERALQKGWRIFLCADVFVFHNHGQTFKSKFTQEKKMEMFNRNKEIFEKKFNRGKYEKEIDELDDLNELRLFLKKKNFEIERLGAIIENNKIKNTCNERSFMFLRNIKNKIKKFLNV